MLAEKEKHIVKTEYKITVHLQVKKKSYCPLVLFACKNVVILFVIVCTNLSVPLHIGIEIFLSFSSIVQFNLKPKNHTPPSFPIEA